MADTNNKDNPRPESCSLLTQASNQPRKHSLHNAKTNHHMSNKQVKRLPQSSARHTSLSPAPRGQGLSGSVVLCSCVWVCVRLADGSAGGLPEPRCRRHKKKGRKCICRPHRMRCWRNAQHRLSSHQTTTPHPLSLPAARTPFERCRLLKCLNACGHLNESRWASGLCTCVWLVYHSSFTSLLRPLSSKRSLYECLLSKAIGLY